jgi:ribosomal protein L11 methyltransferase
VPQLALTLTLDGLDVERVEQACLEFGALAVSYTDQRDDPILEPAPGEFRLWPHSRLQALFPFETSPEKLVAGLSHVLRVDPARLGVETLADKVWEREWLRDFHPMCFGRRLWVAPHHAHVHTTGAVVVRLDPGLAFGTGTHATTAMCLAWLDEHAAEGQLAIDYGCGSGVLAVAACKLGARAAHAFDIDPQALTATRDNATANGVADCVRVVDNDSALPGNADILLANILCGPLCELAPRFAALTRPGGRIVLAGLLSTQADEVTRAHAPWFDVTTFASRDGWTALTGTRREA